MTHAGEFPTYIRVPGGERLPRVGAHCWSQLRYPLFAEGPRGLLVGAEVGCDVVKVAVGERTGRGSTDFRTRGKFKKVTVRSGVTGRVLVTPAVAVSVGVLVALGPIS